MNKLTASVVYQRKMQGFPDNLSSSPVVNKGNNKITELRTILQRESQNS